MDLLVQKPQFDGNVLTPGKAVHIKDVSHLTRGYGNDLTYDSGLKSIDVDAIITDVAPLEIRVVYCDTKRKAERSTLIPVTVVADKLIEIKLLEVTPCKTI